MSLYYQHIEVTLELTEAILGTVTEDRAAWETFIRPKASPLVKDGQGASALSPEKLGAQEYAHAVDVYLHKTQDEAAMMPEEEPDGADKPKKIPLTTFFRDAKGPMLLNYQILGHLKELGNIGKDSVGVKNLRNKIEKYCYVGPRKIYFDQDVIGECVRPLRAETLQGPRIALAASDVIPAGTRLTFTVDILQHPPAKGQKEPEVTADVLHQLMEEIGCKRGIGQWRSGGWGVYEIKEWEVTNY